MSAQTLPVRDLRVCRAHGLLSCGRCIPLYCHKHTVELQDSGSCVLCLFEGEGLAIR